MRFSIIIPAYNSEAYIENALKSVLKQSYDDYELIVICDSCNDNTEQIARLYTNRVVSVAYNNDGLARSKGLDIARGDWILFIDDDDWWLHEFVLQQISDELDKHPDIDVLCFGFVWKDVGYASPPHKIGELYPAVWNKCWRRSFIGDTRFPRIYEKSDYCFHIEMMRKNPRIYSWDMPIYYYNYLRDGSVSQKVGHTVEEAKQALNWRK